VAQDDLLKEMGADMDKGITALRTRLGQVRTGRASVSLLDNIRVDYYGNATPLNQVATLAVPEPRLITVGPWEKSMLGPIEKAIQKSDLGLNPQNDGKIIRIPIPELTGERRKELVKHVHKEGETGKIAVRTTRRDYIDLVKQMEKDKEISEDESRKLQTRIQEITDKYIEKIDELLTHKEKEITEI
jgi:ribosome recycling factor